MTRPIGIGSSFLRSVVGLRGRNGIANSSDTQQALHPIKIRLVAVEKASWFLGDSSCHRFLLHGHYCRVLQPTRQRDSSSMRLFTPKARPSALSPPGSRSCIFYPFIVASAMRPIGRLLLGVGSRSGRNRQNAAGRAKVNSASCEAIFAASDSSISSDPQSYDVK